MFTSIKDSYYWKLVKNVGATTIAAYNIARVTDVTLGGTSSDTIREAVITVTTPDSTTGTTYGICGNWEIEAGKYGLMCFGPNVVVAYDTGTPTNGDTYGPKDGQGTLNASGSPKLFTILGIVDSTLKLALASVLGGSSGGYALCHAVSAIPSSGTSSYGPHEVEDVTVGAATEVYNPFNFAVDAGGLMHIAQNMGEIEDLNIGDWYIIMAKCATTVS